MPPAIPVPPASASRRERPWPFVLALLAAAAAIVLPLAHESGRGAALVAAEDEAVHALQRLHAAQRSLHARTGRYGWIEDLAAAGLLAGLAVCGDADDRYVASPGYRLDVLLPSGRLGSGGVGLVARSRGSTVTADLAERHFAVVARPTAPGVTGWRAWYLDEEDVLYVHEGVTDLDAALANPLPTTQVRRSQPMQSGRQLLWQRLQDLDASDD